MRSIIFAVVAMAVPVSPADAGTRTHRGDAQWCAKNRACQARVTRRELRQAIRRVAVYGPCYGGRWAVPCEIIGGESKGDWSVENRYGCKGPYQFCGWDVPWPVLTLRARLAHHRMAARLWNGGRGCEHWSQTSSAC